MTAQDPTKPTIHVKHHSYQPSKAEMEETVNFANSDGSMPSPIQNIPKILEEYL